MTAEEQIKALMKVGCEDAVQEIGDNGNCPLSSDRLDYHIEIAISTGLVARVETLVAIKGTALTGPQVERLTKVCLKLEWIVDALSASKLGIVSEQTRQELIKALIAGQIADSQEQAVELLDDKE